MRFYTRIGTFLTTREAAWCIISVAHICLYVCNAITFESFDIGSLFLHIWYIPSRYGSSLYMVTGSGFMSQVKNGPQSLFLQCNTLIGNNSGSIKYGIEPRSLCAVWGFRLWRIEWWRPSLLRYSMWPRIHKCIRKLKYDNSKKPRKPWQVDFCTSDISTGDIVQVKFIYESHQANITGVKMVDSLCSCNV